MQNTKDKRLALLRDAPPARAILEMGVPLIAGMFIMVLYNLVDTYFIGKMQDDYQLAAVNLSYPVMMIMVALSNMVGTGASSLIARSLGAGNKRLADHTVTSAFLLTAVSSLLVTIAGLALLPLIVHGLGARDNTTVPTAQYVRILLLGSIFTMGSYTLGQLLRSEGSVGASIAGMIAGTLTNIVLDPLFIFTFGMRIRGAAIATILGNAVSMLVSLQFYLRRRTLLHPQMRYLYPTTQILGEIFWVGIPATLETLLTSAAYIVNNNLAVGYGELTVAAMGVAQKILSFGNYVYQGFAAGTQPIMGYNYGARNYGRMLRVLRSGVIIVTAVESCILLVCGIFAPFLIDFFSDEAETVVVGTQVLRAMIWILPFVGSISMSRMSFQAMGKPHFAFGITLMRQLVLYVPLLLFLNRTFGFSGMIWAQPATELIMMAVSVTLLYAVIRHEAGHSPA